MQPPGGSGDTGRLARVPILVVEDDPANARMLAAVFASEGAAVRIAANGDDALQLLDVFPARIAVVDVLLPTMSGLRLARALTSGAVTPNLMVIAVSALNGPDLERLALESGCAAYVRKPIDIDGLVATVIELLKGTAS